MNQLQIKDMGARGRGVILTASVKSGALIERCPIIFVPPEQRISINETSLKSYYFNWPFIWEDEGPALVIALGYGSLYNHGYTPNIRYELNPHLASVDFYALRDIAAGEELLHNYRGRDSSQECVGFEVK